MYSTEEGAHTKLQLHGNRVDPATTASQPPRRGPLPCVFQGMHFVNFSSQPVHQFVESYIVDQPTSPDSLPHDWLEPPRPWQLQRQAVAIADSTAQSRAETWIKLPQPPGSALSPRLSTARSIRSISVPIFFVGKRQTWEPWFSPGPHHRPLASTMAVSAAHMVLQTLPYLPPHSRLVGCDQPVLWVTCTVCSTYLWSYLHIVQSA